jgi:ribosome maturation factor RimP
VKAKTRGVRPDQGRARPKRPVTRLPENVVAAVRPVASSVCAALDVVLWDVTFVREAGRETLRVACDRPGGITAAELGSVAEDLSRELDHTDAVRGDKEYVLEVTSPGAERKIQRAEQFGVCTGRRVKIILSSGSKVFGTITGASDKSVELETDKGPTSVQLDDIARARLVIEGFGESDAGDPPRTKKKKGN